MKKIMFNDKYGLTQAVLEGRKTQTRRVPSDIVFQRCRSLAFAEKGFTHDWEKRCVELLLLNAQYSVGEVVAVAQRYKDIILPNNIERVDDLFRLKKVIRLSSKGETNKMFVRAKLMPHRIRITNVRVERLQDISEEDCLNEGLQWWHGIYYVNYNKKTGSRMNLGNDYKKAYAALIDKTCGAGTWESNPYVFVYDFELVK